MTLPTKRTPSRCTIAPISAAVLLWFGGLLLSFAPEAVAGIEACARDGTGGMAICTEPIIVPSGASADSEQWSYGECDDAAAYSFRDRAWCEVKGGTWVTPAAYSWRCDGASPTFDAQIVPYARAFETKIYRACQIGNTDTGWGVTVSSWNCYSGGSLSTNGIPVREFRQLDFQGLSLDSLGRCGVPWAERVFAIRTRSVTCPQGYNTRGKANGDLECWYLPASCDEPSCSTRVGNPVSAILGNKMQEETDYRSAAQGGLELLRYYNSGGVFQLAAGPARGTDFWRTNWDRRILADVTTAANLAYAQRPDGSVKVFLPDGRELHNASGGGADVLARLVDGAGTLTGWQLTTAARDVETYDAAGRLQSLVTRAGFTYTLAYDAGGRPASVADSFERMLVFGHDGDGRLASVMLPDNTRVLYAYAGSGELASVTYPDNTIRTYVYENGAFPRALTGIIDENSQRYATWTYDGKGRTETSEHAGGAERVSLAYPPINGTLGNTTVTDALGAARVYRYSALGGAFRLTQRSRPCPDCTNVPEQFAYDANGNLASRTDFNGNRTTHVFDSTRNLEVSRTEAAGTALARTIATEWHPTYRLPTRITAPSPVAGGNVVTDLIHDARGNLIRKTITGPKNDGTAATASRAWSWTYATFGRVAAATDPNDNVTAYTYYADDDPDIGKRGNMATVTNPLGHTTRITAYDANGRPLAIVDANGLDTLLTYHPRGWLASRATGGELTTYAYDSVGQLAAVTLPDGSTLAYAYDAAHRLIEIADGIGNSILHTLDAVGNRIREDVYGDAGHLARTRGRVFNALSRLAYDVGAQAQTTTYSYDGVGNLLTTTDPLTHQTSSRYDALNRLLQVTDPAGGVTRYAYDPAGNLSQVTDPRGLATRYTYDGLGNMVQQVSPDTGTATHTYDAAGNLVSKVDARGVVASYTYDALNRVIEVGYSSAGSPSEIHSFDYDGRAIGAPNAAGRLTGLTDPVATTRWTYTRQGRVASKSQQAGSLTQTVRYAYDAAGQRAGITTPSGQTLGYSYRNNRVAGITVNGVPLVSYVITAPFGPVGAWQWGNALYSFRDYDADGRLKDWEFRNGTSVLRNNLTWDAASRITAIVDPANAALQGMYQYDALDRLTVAQSGSTAAHTWQFGYDAVGNRVNLTVDGVLTNLAYAATSNQLTAMSGALSPDPLHGDTDRSYAYNLANRLVQVQNGGGVLASYQVNALGQRVAKTVGGVLTRFVYDEQGHLLGEYDAAGRLIQETVWLEDLPVATLRPKAGSTTDPVAVEVFYVHADHLGSPRAVTRPADNAVVWRWDNIDPFGANAADENPGGQGTFVFALRFPGQYYDAETGTHYNYMRDYDPSVGRYSESDPMGIWGGLNTYAYVENDPLDLFDPRGENIHGNWCGPGGGGPAIDAVDQCCKDHDGCYDRCNGDWKNHMLRTGGTAIQAAMTDCDRSLCSCLKSAKPNGATAEARARFLVAVFFRCLKAPGVHERNPSVWR